MRSKAGAALPHGGKLEKHDTSDGPNGNAAGDARPSIGDRYDLIHVMRSSQTPR
jgi:hypothetical protein